MGLSKINEVLTLLVYAFIFVVGTLGNVVVAIYFGWKLPERRSSTYHVFIVQLAVADFLSSLTVPLLAWYHSLQTIIDDGWIFGNVLSSIWLDANWTFSMVTLWNRLGKIPWNCKSIKARNIKAMDSNL